MASTFLTRRRFTFFFLPSKFPPSISFAIHRSLSDASPSTSPRSPETDPKLSLSARLSFVFDQIDALERQRDTSAKDEALQRIRAWRQSKHPAPSLSSSTSSAVSDTDADGGRRTADTLIREGSDGSRVGMAEIFRREVEVSHPWPEWIELMERLASQNYFDTRRVEEDRFAANAGVDISSVKEEVGLDLTRDWGALRAASMNFGRDRFDILRSLSKKDIQDLVGHGCPSMDSKVVFSAKLLRKYVHLDEGDVCSSCSLRTSCSRGYILVPKEDEARTLDVMRILVIYGYDFIEKCVENDPLRKMKSVKTIVRKLLHEVTKLSSVPRDPNLLPPVIKKLPPKVKQPPPQPRRRVGRDDVEMKKGDWLCTKCDFLNFAKNTVCLQCDAKRPKRHLLPGEWECPKCNFLNYRRNMSCFQCEQDRPPDEFTENNELLEKRTNSNSRMQNAVRTSDVSNAWNFDFDDDESDGADVAAFEFADSTRANSSSFNKLHCEGNSTEDIVKDQNRGQYFSNHGKADASSQSRATGFNDFDDEEGDNVDDYELDDANGRETRVILRKNFSELEESGSELENSDSDDQRANLKQHSKDYLTDSEEDDIVQGENDLKWRKKVQKSTDRKSFSRGRESDYSDDDEEEDAELYTNKSMKRGTNSASERTGRNFRGSCDRSGRNYNDEDEDSYSRGSKIRDRFPDFNRAGSKNNGRKSFDRHDFDKFDSGSKNGRRNSFGRHDNKSDDDREGSNVRRDRTNNSSYGARSFQKSGASFKRTGHGSRTDYSQREKNDRGSRTDYGHHERNGHGGRSDYRQQERNSHGSRTDYRQQERNGRGGRTDYRQQERNSRGGRTDYRQHERSSRDHAQFRGSNADNDFDDNRQNRRIIER